MDYTRIFATPAGVMDRDVNWLSAEDWAWVQDHLPIACADVVPVRMGGDGRIEKIGLIFRDTPHQGRRWCIVGGRMWRNESLTEAATRQIRETLGTAAQFHIEPDRQPDYVAQYFTSPRDIGLHDPRQHAITLAIVVAIEGEIVPGGEALAFQWFDPDRLPPAEEWGFGQEQVVWNCLAAADSDAVEPRAP